MSYDSVRMDEQMRVLEPSIEAFITRYNAISGSSPPSPRQTLFLFPGGMASKLKRATKAWNPAGPTSQIFNYEELWGEILGLLGGAARDLKMETTRAGGYRDKGSYIIVADGLANVFGFTPYMFFTLWCTVTKIDLFVFPWDWRRSVDDVGRFFVDRFLPDFRERVQNGCNNADPLADYSLIGHSAGGMVVNWIFRNATLPGTLRKAITVAAPFYGYGGQLHRWFEGDDLVNLGGLYTKAIIRALSSFPGCYSWHFLPLAFYTANAADFQNDPANPAYPLPSYPSVDATTNGPVDPYDPLPVDERYPTQTQSGFDPDELTKAAALFGQLTSPLSPAQAAKFVNIRGDTTANNTFSTTTWQLVPPILPSPIADSSLAPGDGTQPAWTTRDIGLARQVPGNVITVTGGDTAHLIILDSPQTIAQVAAVLGIP
jgi:hypothetical protein